MTENELADMKIKSVRYTALMNVIKQHRHEFPDKKGADVQLVRDAADAVFFDPSGKMTPELTGQAFSMLKNIALKKRMDAPVAGELITALQRLVSATQVQLPPGRPSEMYPGTLTGFDKLRANGEHII